MQMLVQRCLHRLACAHLLHFLLLGLGVWWLVTGGAPATRVVVIQAGDIEQTAHEWAALQGSPVTQAQRQAIAEQLVREALLVDFARASGLQRSPAVRQRLLQLGRFLGLAPDSSTDDKVIAAARKLGLGRSDRVIRRYLQTAAAIMLGHDLPVAPPGDAEIASLYRDHHAQFTSPREIALSHVFVGGNNAAGRTRAEALLKRIRNQQLDPDSVSQLGDTFHGGYRFAPQTEQRIATTMGEGFAKTVAALPAGQWSGPVASAYGWHLVYIERVIPARVQPLAAVRAQVMDRLERGHRKAAVARYITNLRRNYNVIIVKSANG